MTVFKFFIELFSAIFMIIDLLMCPYTINFKIDENMNYADPNIPKSAHP